MPQIANTNFYPSYQMEYRGMYEPYMQKNSDVFDVSLSIPESRSSIQPSYMNDQQNLSNNFSPFESGGGGVNRGGTGGGEHFPEMNPMNVTSLGGHHEPPHTSSHPIQPPQQPHHQALYQMGVAGGHLGGNNPQFPPQHMYIPPISQHGQLMATQTTGYGCGGLGGPVPPVYTSAGIMNAPPPPHPMMGAAPGGLMHYYPRPQGVRTAGGSPHNSVGSPSPGSEDSDDATISQGGKGKRPSPEVPADASAQSTAKGGTGKKPRVSKKSKKKKDPNEPSKPVSAYALFFRDTQAAIKGSNPNASFGEVSKIVASMWDALDAENKGVYKKKTEAAKKEYLKALAAYRASLVSKGEGEAVFPGHAGAGAAPPGPGGNYQPYGFPPATSAPHQQSHSPPQISPLIGKKPTSLMNPMMGGPDGSMMGPPPMSQPMPPSAPSMMPLGPSSMAPPHANPSHGLPSSGPHLTPLTNVQHPPNSPYLVQQNNPSLSSPVSSLGNEVNSPGSGVPLGAPPPQQGSPPHQLHTLHPHHPQHHHQQQQQHMQPHHHQQPPPPPQQQQQQQQNPGGSVNGGGAGGAVHQSAPPSSNGMPNCQAGSCIRSGCSNPAVHNPEWEDEYCSNECVVSHCRDVFNSWVQSGQSGNPTYPAPVK